ncbi:MAG: arginine--tRNA ligase, partial [Bdellovibrio sp.]
MIKHDSIRLLATQKISEALQKLNHSLSEEEIYKALVEPPQSDMGDLAFGCFTLAKALKKGPPQIAAEIAQNMSLDSSLKKAQAAGPYLNLTFSAECFGKKVLASILDESFFKKQLVESSPKTMIEYSQPNTHKELHVGHMRNLCLGDAIVRMLRYSGREIVSSTFPGDMGTHVAKCLWYMKKHNTEPAPAEHKGEWL